MLHAAEKALQMLAHAVDSASSERMLIPGYAYSCTPIVLNGSWLLGS